MESELECSIAPKDGGVSSRGTADARSSTSTAHLRSEDVRERTSGQESSEHSDAVGGGNAGHVGSGNSKKTSAVKRTRGKVWTGEEVLLLIAAWKAASLERLPDGHTAKHAAAAVYSAYISRLLLTKAQLTGEDVENADVFLRTVAKAPQRPEGGLDVTDAAFRPRSQRAVEDKMASLKSTYSLIADHNNGTLVGSTGRPAWFEMLPSERSEILKKWGRVALTEDCYTSLGDIFEDDPSVEPIGGGVEIGAAELLVQQGAAKATSSGSKRSRSDDLAAVMHDVMSKAVKSMEDIAQRDREIFYQHQRNENQKTRDLLRELFSKQ